MDWYDWKEIIKDVAMVFLAAIVYAPIGISVACLAAWLATR